MKTNNTKFIVPKVYAAQSRDDAVLLTSSSGGVFSELARVTIESGGVVFGSRFDENLDVVCDYTDRIAGLAPFRGSKYVMSHIGTAYKDALAFLKQGRNVLFTGTPCQIAGLHRFVGREYDNLTTVEVVCHGAPGKEVWHKYLETLGNTPGYVNFRTKPEGWKNYHIKIGDLSELYSQNAYMQAFLSDVSLRESCYHCKVKGGKSEADITLGDFWGIDHIHPEIDDDRGLSLLIVRTSKGAEIVDKAHIVLNAERYEDALRFNPAMEKSANRPVYRNIFMQTLSRKGFNSAFELTFSRSLIKKIHRKILLLLKK